MIVGIQLYCKQNAKIFHEKHKSSKDEVRNVIT